MSTQITTAHVKSFRDGIDDLARQRGSRFREAVRVESFTGDREFYDQIGATSMTALSSRHGDTPLTDTPHSRRMVVPTPYVVADLIDEQDLVRILNDPRGAYSRSMADAVGHTTDDTLIAAAFATANVGVDGGDTAGFDTANYQITSGSNGLTLAKIIQAKEILMAAENDPDETWYLAYSARQLRDVLNEPTITSADYNSVKLLMAGSINSFMGFEWIHSERLTTASAERQCIAWAKNSLLLGLAMESRASIRVRPDKNDSIQVRYAVDLGATRMDETGVVEILCDET